MNKILETNNKLTDLEFSTGNFTSTKITRFNSNKVIKSYKQPFYDISYSFLPILVGGFVGSLAASFVMKLHELRTSWI